MTTFVETSDRTIKDNLIQRYPLISFFRLAFGLTWSLMIADALGSHGILPFRLPIPLLILMGYMPTLAAVIVTWQTKGKEGIRALFRKLLIARVGLGWYAFAIGGIAIPAALSILLYNSFASGPLLPYTSLWVL